MASEVFSQDLLDRVDLQVPLGQEPLEPLVFLLQLPQSSRLRDRKPRVLAPPPIERELRNPLLPADLHDRHPARFSLLQNPDDLLLSEPLLLHRSSSFLGQRILNTEISRGPNFGEFWGVGPSCSLPWGSRSVDSARESEKWNTWHVWVRGRNAPEAFEALALVAVLSFSVSQAFVAGLDETELRCRWG